MTAATPGQAAYEAFQRAFPGHKLASWEDVVALYPGEQGAFDAIAQAVVDAATEGSLRACGYTLADVGRFLEAEAAPALPKVHAHPDDLFDAWWDETYEPDEGPQAPDRHVPRDAFRAGWDSARALLAPNGGRPQPAPEQDLALAALLADRNQLREYLRRIALGIAGDPSVAADKALTVSRDYREQWEVLEQPKLAPGPDVCECGHYWAHHAFSDDVCAVADCPCTRPRPEPKPAPEQRDPAPGVSFTADRQAAGKPDITGIQAALHGRTPKPAPELDAADSLVRDILESLCRRDGLSVESAVVPGEAARNYELAIRLGIGQVFGLAAATPARPAPELAAAMAESRQLRELLAEIIGSFSMGSVVGGQTKGDAIACVGRSQLAKWHKRAGLPS